MNIIINQNLINKIRLGKTLQNICKTECNINQYRYEAARLKQSLPYKLKCLNVFDLSYPSQHTVSIRRPTEFVTEYLPQTIS